MEQRRHPRLKRPLDGQWMGAAGNRQCRIVDIGFGGCFIETLATPATGELTCVGVTLNGRAFELKGRVAYVEPKFGFAVVFDELAAEDSAEFAQALEVLAALSP